jgi:galactose-1-phosphate uridylyltransferase
MFSMVLILLGFAVALGPVLYGVHITVAGERARRARVVSSLFTENTEEFVEDREKLCPFCGGAVRPTDLVDTELETEYAAS